MNRHQPGLVVAAWRRHFAVRLDDGEIVACVLKGRRTALACGDRVAVARIAGGGAIESVETRSSLIYRSDAFREKLVAARREGQTIWYRIASEPARAVVGTLYSAFCGSGAAGATPSR